MDQAQINENWSLSSEEILRNNFPLHRACRDGDLEALAPLLSTGDPNFYEEDDFYGWTPIHWSSYFGKLACLMGLLERGACCDIPTERLNQTPAHIAAYGGQIHCLKCLLHGGACINRQDYLGETPVHKAARTGSMECINFLVSQGAKLSIRSHADKTPSQIAAESGFPECANFLETALQMQQQANGVYEELRTPVTHPSNNRLSPIPNPLSSKPDLTPSGPEAAVSSSRNKFVINGYYSNSYIVQPTPDSNGISYDNNNTCNGISHTDDIDMDTVETDMEEVQTPLNQMNGVINGAVPKVFMNGGGCRDLMLEQGVMMNGLPLAGKKRCRDDGDIQHIKRARCGGTKCRETALNNNVLSSYNAVLAISTEPLSQGVGTCTCHLDDKANNSSKSLFM